MFGVILLFFKAARMIRKSHPASQARHSYIGEGLLMSCPVREGSLGIHTVTRAVMPRGHTVTDIAILFIHLIVSAAMFGAADALFRPYTAFPIASITTLAIVFLVVYFGMNGLVKANALLVPLIMIFIAAVCIFNIANPVQGGGGAPGGGSAGSPFLYAGMNMILACGIIFGAKTDKKTGFISALAASVIITVFLVLIIFAAFAGNASGAELPIVNLSARMNLTIPALVIIWSGILTSVGAAAYSLHSSAKQFVKNKPLSLFLVLAAGWILSRAGFGRIISIFYPLAGSIGIVFILLVAWFVLRKSPHFAKMSLCSTLPLRNGLPKS
jgi:uncharacterized membrane protein YkvI